jgi:hypothetical protein
MSELTAIISQSAQQYIRKKDGEPGLIVKAYLEDNTPITLYGKDGDRLLLDLREGDMIMVSKNGNFYSITHIMEDGEFVPVNQPTQTNAVTTNHKSHAQIDTEQVKIYIRWHAKILAYCHEQNSEHGDLLYQQACKKFDL